MRASTGRGNKERTGKYLYVEGGRGTRVVDEWGVTLSQRVTYGWQAVTGMERRGCWAQA